jgi:hypothetical protein
MAFIGGAIHQHANGIVGLFGQAHAGLLTLNVELYSLFFSLEQFQKLKKLAPIRYFLNSLVDRPDDS